MLRGHRRAESLEIGRAVPPHHVGDGRHRTTPPSASRSGAGLFLAQRRQMEIDHRGLQRAVTQVLLDQPEVDSGLEQVGGIAVPERVDRDRPCGSPSSWTTRRIAAWTLSASWVGRRSPSAGTVAARGRKEPARVAMRGPVLAEHRQGAPGQRHVAVLGPLAAMHVHEHPLAVDVADLQVQPFLESQAERVDRPEVGPVVGRADGVDESSHLVDREHVGERLRPGDAEPLERRPVAGRGVGVEELDAAVGDLQRRGGELASFLRWSKYSRTCCSVSRSGGVWKWSASCRTARR